MTKFKKASYLFFFLELLGLLTSLSLFTSEIVFASEDQLDKIQEVFEPSEKPDERLYAKVAVIQWAPSTAPLNVTLQQAEEIKQRNRLQLTDLINEAARNGAQWVVSSEMSVVGYPYHPDVPPAEDNFLTREEIFPYLETVPGVSSVYFGELAKKLNIHIQFGLAELEPSTQKIYNTGVLIDPQGSVVLTHRKWGLYHVESKYFSQGSDSHTYDSIFGPVGILICADVYNSALLSNYISKGVRVLNLSTSWAQMNTGMNYFRRAATTVKAYLLAANQPYYPDSGVVSPSGQNQSHIRQSNGVAYGYLPYFNGH
jgi:predicted amidohydrolase